MDTNQTKKDTLMLMWQDNVPVFSFDGMTGHRIGLSFGRLLQEYHFPDATFEIRLLKQGTDWLAVLQCTGNDSSLRPYYYQPKLQEIVAKLNDDIQKQEDLDLTDDCVSYFRRRDDDFYVHVFPGNYAAS